VAERIRPEDRECPLSATLGLVGDWWTLLILHDAFDGYTRYDQFQENLAVSSSLLAGRLKRLVEAGIFERSSHWRRGVMRGWHRTSAAWCWSTPKQVWRQSRSSSTAPPADG
jgi:DNA-binding HxlR family transcriptional regulator